MRTIWIAMAACALALATLPAAALAQDPAGEATTRYDFEDELVRGDLVRPDGEILAARRRMQRRTLIRPRESFVAELYKAIENL